MMKLRLLFSLFAIMTLVSLKAQILSVGLIGSATPGGWDADTNMVQDMLEPNVWTLEITLITGAAKFRANDDWAINWGGNTFPSGIGVQDGPDILIPAGDYSITFNSSTGAYLFELDSDIGIIGSATPFGWNADVNLSQDLLDTNVYSTVLTLTIGEAKFRQNDDWAVNWGASDFPSGIGVQDGPNIPIPVGGDYVITFNKSTGAYNFQLASFSTVGLIGDATAGGNIPTPMSQNPNNPREWYLQTELSDGSVQFSGDNGLVVWGGTDFPSGIASVDGDPIPITAGAWVIGFNSVTLEYSFTPIEYYDVVGLIGDATPGGWDADTDMQLVGSDLSEWKLRIILTDGEAKFRANHAWEVNWGAGEFPTGTALRDGPNIPITAGEYNVFFNSFTSVYNFVEILVYSTVGLVGTGTPLMSWDVDVDMTRDAGDENLWTLASVDLVDGEVKFRAEDAWTVNWGAVDFPSGTGTQDGPNIPVVAGTYGVTLNSGSGEYAFGDPLVSTKDLLDPSSIKAFPNPASDVLNIDISAIDLRGEVNLNVYDVNGKLVQSEVQQANEQMQLGVSLLQPGYYMLQITNDKYIIGKKFAIIR